MKRFIYQAKKEVDNAVNYIINDPKLSIDEKLQKICDKLAPLNSKYMQLLPEEERETKVATQKKKNARKEAVLITVATADLLTSHGHMENFIPFKLLEDFTYSYLMKCKAEEFTTKLTFLREQMADHDPQRISAGVTDEDLVEYDDAFNNFKEIESAPTQQRNTHKQVLEEMFDTTTDMKKILDKGIIPYVRGKYARKSPDTYNGLIAAITHSAAPVFHHSLMGTLREKETGLPLHDVIITVDKEEPVVRGGKKGNFYFNNLPGGLHKLKFELPGYLPVEQSVVIVAGRTIKIEVEMELISTN